MHDSNEDLSIIQWSKILDLDVPKSRIKMFQNPGLQKEHTAEESDLPMFVKGTTMYTNKGRNGHSQKCIFMMQYYLFSQI